MSSVFIDSDQGQLFIVIKTFQMNSEVSNQFTFKANSSRQQVGRVSKIISEHRNQQDLNRKSTRKYKIFQQNALFTNSPYKSNKTNISQNTHKTQTKNSKFLQNSLTGSKMLEKSQQVPQKNHYQQLVQNTKNYKTAIVGSEKQNIINQLARKEREINILKLQLDRARRCQRLKKSNQQIYQKLIINHQKDTQIVIEKDYQSGHPNYTPIQSLVQIKIPPSQQSLSPTRRSHNPIHSQSRYNSAHPLQTIVQNQQNQIQSQVVKNIKNTPQSKRRLNYSLQSKLYEADPLYLKIQSQMNASRRSKSRVNVNELPVNMRLSEMNKTLQYNYKDYARRNSQRHSSQRKNRAQVYLQNNFHY